MCSGRMLIRRLLVYSGRVLTQGLVVHSGRMLTRGLLVLNKWVLSQGLRLHALISKALLGLGNAPKIYLLQRKSLPSLGAHTGPGVVIMHMTDIQRKLRIHPRCLCIKQTHALRGVPGKSPKASSSQRQSQSGYTTPILRLWSS